MEPGSDPPLEEHGGALDVELVGPSGGYRLGLAEAASGEDLDGWWFDQLLEQAVIQEPGSDRQSLAMVLQGHHQIPGPRNLTSFAIPQQIADGVASGALVRKPRDLHFDLVFDRLRLLALLSLSYGRISEEPGIRRLADPWPGRCSVTWDLPRTTELSSMHLHRDNLVRSFSVSAAVRYLYARGIELIDADTYATVRVKGAYPKLQVNLNQLLGEELILGTDPLRLSRPVLDELLARFDPRPGQKILREPIEDVYCLYRRDVRRMIRIHRNNTAEPGREAALAVYREILHGDAQAGRRPGFSTRFMLQHGVDLRAGTFTSEEHSAADVAMWLHLMNEGVDDLILAALERAATRLDPGFLESAVPPPPRPPCDLSRRARRSSSCIPGGSSMTRTRGPKSVTVG